MKKWTDLPAEMQSEEVRPYYELLKKKKLSRFWKRVFDITVSLILLILLSPVFLVLAIAIKLDSKGSVFYRQVRITRYGREFRIHKFRSMVQNADRLGAQVTVNQDDRITKVGRIIRKCRLDEIAQLLDVFSGKMTFVGTRPEVPKYVKSYTAEMLATLLLPAGVTSLASIRYKDEAEILNSDEDIDKTYTEKILPEKMKYNLDSLKKFSFWSDVKIMFITAFAVFGKKNSCVKPIEISSADEDRTGGRADCAADESDETGSLQ